MTESYLNSCTLKTLTGLAKKQGITGLNSPTKAELVRALLARAAADKSNKKPAGRARLAAGTARTASTSANSKKLLDRPGHSSKKGTPVVARKPVKAVVPVGGVARVKSLVAKTPAAKGKKTNGELAAVAKSTKRNGHSNSRSALRRAELRRNELLPTLQNGTAAREGVCVQLCDPSWLRVTWEISAESLRRAEVRLGAQRHQSLPILRILDVTTEDLDMSAEKWVKDIEITSGGNVWFVPLELAAGRSFRVQIGYRCSQGEFISLGRSEVLSVPRETEYRYDEVRGHVFTQPSGPHHDGSVWSQKANDLRLTSRSATLTRGVTQRHDTEQVPLQLAVETEVLIHGRANPQTAMFVHGERVGLQADGTFSVRVRLPEGRQVVSVEAITPHEQRTLVLGLERNTKLLAAQHNDDAFEDLADE